jgi:hypothetical protein
VALAELGSGALLGGEKAGPLELCRHFSEDRDLLCFQVA